MADTLNVMGRPKKAEPTEQLRIPQSVVKRIRRIAVHLGVDPGDYIAQKLAGHLDKDEEKMVKEIEKAKEEGKGQ